MEHDGVFRKALAEVIGQRLGQGRVAPESRCASCQELDISSMGHGQRQGHLFTCLARVAEERRAKGTLCDVCGRGLLFVSLFGGPGGELGEIVSLSKLAMEGDGV